MKYFILFLVAIFFIPSLQASDQDLFSYDKTRIDNAFNDLSRVEKIINDNPASDPLDLVEKGQIEAVTFNQFKSSFGFGSEPPLGIPSFLWGCVFGVVGMVIVVIMTDKDKAELQKAFYGCITTYAIIGVFYLFAMMQYSGL